MMLFIFIYFTLLFSLLYYLLYFSLCTFHGENRGFHGDNAGIAYNKYFSILLETRNLVRYFNVSYIFGLKSVCYANIC